MANIDMSQLLAMASEQAESDVLKDAENSFKTESFEDDDPYVDQEILIDNGFVRSESTETSTVAGKVMSAAVTVRYSRRRQLDPPCAAQTFARRCTIVMHSINVAKTHNVRKLSESADDGLRDEFGKPYPQPGDPD